MVEVYNKTLADLYNFNGIVKEELEIGDRN